MPCSENMLDHQNIAEIIPDIAMTFGTYLPGGSEIRQNSVTLLFEKLQIHFINVILKNIVLFWNVPDISRLPKVYFL